MADLGAHAEELLSRNDRDGVACQILVKRWLEASNFNETDHERLLRLVILAPDLICDAAEELWMRYSMTWRGSDALVRALGDSAGDPRVLAVLTQRLQRWLGSYSIDPFFWHFRWDQPFQPMFNVAESVHIWAANEHRYHRSPGKNLRCETYDWLADAALAIIARTRRAPFIDALMTYALAHAVMWFWPLNGAFYDLLTENNRDAEETDALIDAEVQKLRALHNSIAERMIEVLTHAI